MIPYATCRVPLRVFAPTVIPVCDHWNRSKTEVLSAQDGQTQIQGQTNIRPLPRLIKKHFKAKKKYKKAHKKAAGQKKAQKAHVLFKSTLYEHCSLS